MVSFAGLFGAALAGLYEDAVLHRRASPSYDDGGAITAGSPTTFACKAQAQAVTERMRAADGYADTDQRIFILASSLATEPTTEDELTLRGVRWGIASVDQDPARTYWDIRGRRRG
jgi:hypothetical protein